MNKTDKNLNVFINLCELLKGHEGETFYTPLAGDVKLESVEHTIGDFPIRFFSAPLSSPLLFTKDGKYQAKGIGECLIFPSKDQRDWDKWEEEQIAKNTKTWNDINYADVEVLNAVSQIDYGSDEPILKAAAALIKIYELIEIGYGGVPTSEEKMNEDNFVYVPDYDCYDMWAINKTYRYTGPIAFHTYEQCKEFLSYPENVQLLKDFYML